MLKRLLAYTSIVVLLAGVHGCGGSDDGGAPAPTPFVKTDTQAPQAWNGIAIQALQNFAAVDPNGGFPPPIDGRILAMAFVAAHDALNAIDRRFKPYLTDTSAPTANPDAAVAAAMHDVLKGNIPTQDNYLDQQYTMALAAIPDGAAKTAGVALGQTTARTILAARATDGFAAVDGPYTSTGQPGNYQITPPYTFAGFVNSAGVKLFVVPSHTTFRAPPPPALTDVAYTRDYVEIKALGRDISTMRTADQTQMALFWLENTTETFARIAASIAKAKGLNGWDQARLYALVELAEADTYFTVESAKYAYARWRPVTAIHNGDNDGNPDTVGDATWTPLRLQPPDPDYPSGHAAAGGAGAAVLTGFFGGDAISLSYTSLSLPTATRAYTSLAQIASEIAASRVYVGFHFRTSTERGRDQGAAIGDYVVKNTLQPV